MAEPNVVSTHQLHIPPRKGVDEPPISCNISIRTGATPELIVHTLDHFRQAVIALWHGFRPADEIWGKRSSCGVENSTGEALVLIWSNEVFMLLPNGKRKKVSINKFHEKTTALECVMQIEISQNAINDFHKLVLEGYEREAAQVGEKPATLQPIGDLNAWFTGDNDEGAVIPAPDTPYPVPTIVERTMIRQRHNPFENEPASPNFTFGDIETKEREKAIANGLTFYYDMNGQKRHVHTNQVLYKEPIDDRNSWD